MHTFKPVSFAKVKCLKKSFKAFGDSTVWINDSKKKEPEPENQKSVLMTEKKEPEPERSLVTMQLVIVISRGRNARRDR